MKRFVNRFIRRIFFPTHAVTDAQLNSMPQYEAHIFRKESQNSK